MDDRVRAENRAWGAAQRLEFIEFRTFWEGGINRGDLIEKFHVSTPQASNDLSEYRTMAPDNLIYDGSAKLYVRSPTFVPKLTVPSAEGYLAQLKGLTEGMVKLNQTFFGSAPPAVTMPAPGRLVGAETLRDLLAAIRARRSIEVRYQSMNAARPDPIWRRVTPHALASDGLRWHVRGFCHLDARFKDFVLSRVSGLRDSGPAGAESYLDEDWNTLFQVRLEPNPSLSNCQQQAVAWEYGMAQGHVTLPVRLAFLYYLQKRLRLDIQGDSAAETPVVVANRIEFDQTLASARGLVAKGERA